ncbi:MAG: hypothetical protein ABEI13_00565 [Candidatus Paceibacteria bacterium]
MRRFKITTYWVKPKSDEFNVPRTIIVGLWWVTSYVDPNVYVFNRVSRKNLIPIQNLDSAELSALQDKEDEDTKSPSLEEVNQCRVHIPGFLLQLSAGSQYY